MTRLLFAFLLAHGAVQTQPPVPAAKQPPVNSSPAAPVTPLTPGSASAAAAVATPGAADPAAVTFTSDLGMLFVAVKAVGVVDYEAAIVALQAALSASLDEETRTLARSWRVLKASEADAKANTLYIHLLEPPVPSADYRPSLWLDKLLAGAPPEMLAKYRDAFALPPTKLGLVEFAKMAVVPVSKATNATPDAPTVPGKPETASPATPGNVSPARPVNESPAKPGNLSPPKPGNLSPAKPGNTSPAKPPSRH